MKSVKYLLAASLIGISSSAVFANTADYQGQATYEWHLGPPTLFIDGDAASHLKQDLGYSEKGKKIEVTVTCDEDPASHADYCTFELPEQ